MFTQAIQTAVLSAGFTFTPINPTSCTMSIGRPHNKWTVIYANKVAFLRHTSTSASSSTAYYLPPCGFSVLGSLINALNLLATLDRSLAGGLNDLIHDISSHLDDAALCNEEHLTGYMKCLHHTAVYPSEFSDGQKQTFDILFALVNKYGDSIEVRNLVSMFDNSLKSIEKFSIAVLDALQQATSFGEQISFQRYSACPPALRSYMNSLQAACLYEHNRSMMGRGISAHDAYYGV